MKGIENKQQAIVSSDLVSRQFEEIIVEYPEITDREHKGKPYYSIKYVEGGEKYIGYGTYKIDVLSGYIKDYFIPSAQPEPCEDAISRSEAIKVTEAIPDGNWKSIRYSKEIQRLPSVEPEPERKKGTWLMNGEIYGHMYWRCSQCGEEVDYIGANFCPNCGSFNGGEEDE